MTENADLTEATHDIVLKALNEILDELDEGDLTRDQKLAIGGALQRAVIQGVRLGVAEATAQLIEQGIDVKVRMTITDDE